MRSRGGFTMIEVLITIAILGLVMVTAFQLFDGITRAEARAQLGVGRRHAVAILLDRIESELSGTVMLLRPQGTDPLLHPYLFVGGDGGAGIDDRDRLRFITQTPARRAGESAAGGLRMVTYVPIERAEDVVDLMRQEEPLPLALQREIGEEGQTIAEDIASFSLRFVAEDGLEWEDEWDSSQVEHLDTIPMNVEIAVRLMEEDDRGQLVVGDEQLRVVHLPVRPFDLKPRDPNDVSEDDPKACGLFIEECIAQNADVIFPILGHQKEGQLNQLRQALAPQTCWTSTEPLAVSLKLILKAHGINLNQVCK